MGKKYTPLPSSFGLSSNTRLSIITGVILFTVLSIIGLDTAFFLLGNFIGIGLFAPLVPFIGFGAGALAAFGSIPIGLTIYSSAYTFIFSFLFKKVSILRSIIIMTVLIIPIFIGVNLTKASINKEKLYKEVITVLEKRVERNVEYAGMPSNAIHLSLLIKNAGTTEYFGRIDYRVSPSLICEDKHIKVGDLSSSSRGIYTIPVQGATQMNLVCYDKLQPVSELTLVISYPIIKADGAHQQDFTKVIPLP